MMMPNQRRTVFLGLATVLLAFLWPVNGSAAPSSSRPVLKDGIYTETHTVGIYQGPKRDWEDTSVRDCLSVKRVPGTSQYNVDVTLVQANAHLCSYSAEMSLNGNVLIGPEMDAYGEDETKKCVLKIHVESKQFRFEDPDWICKSFCGARAAFDGVTIKRAKTPKKWTEEACGN